MNKKQKYKHGFKVPPSYFKDLEDSVLSNFDATKIPSDTGFKTPEDYFKTVEKRIDLSIKASERKTTKVIPLFSKKSLVFAVSVAASVLLLITLIPFKSNTVQLETIDLASIESYIEADKLDIETYDIIALMEEESLEEFTMKTHLDFSEENLEDYILNTIEDTTLLIE